jgi:hypothetical protein
MAWDKPASFYATKQTEARTIECTDKRGVQKADIDAGHETAPVKVNVRERRFHAHK